MAEEEKGQEQPKGPSPEERQQQSRRDRTIAALERERDTLQKRTTQVEGELESTRSTLELLRQQVQFGDDEEKRVKLLVESERKLRERERVLADAEKRTSARLLHAEYGIPLDDLLEYDDPRDMEIAALKHQHGELLKAQNSKVKESPQKEEEEPEVKPPRVDTGQATRTAPNWADYNLNTKEGREAFAKAESDHTASRKRAQRATA